MLNDRRGVRLDLRSTAALPEQWTHVTISCDRDEARLFIDGRPAGRARYGVPFATEVTPLLIGASENDATGPPGGFLPGRLDEVTRC